MKYFLLIIVIMVLMLPQVSVSAEAQRHDLLETEVMAAMVYNFTKYVEWPSDALAVNNQLTICIAGAPQFNNSFDKYQNKLSNGRVVKVREIGSSQEVQGCSLLFIDGSEQAHLATYLQQTTKMPILTVSNMTGFASLAGMIGFSRLDEQLRFDINLEQIKRSRLVISSKLLKLAKKIY
jgi:hypothetical protein